ncbi:MAG: peroxiredoxin [Candidatus Thermofonsia Clade 1 bacterium]|jgi:peroxiredoxin Q/BCP|uniref:thioredoxin-dependent peroxiredoxin n=1 Tax=Candidatus Thermofonsia Clade 1 bacterium TaxID=2364210 RepID=A0A2M8PFC1_9CHLR|nr:MAG: peroxiredoxin [Candidatus Thermofonsia Clade 1 bacterium]RMF53616.1 MAG: peroxiredoxin [Chloroflexota bacterium]
MSQLPTLQALANIRLQDDSGRTLSLTDFLGKRLLIFFFPKAGTSGCTEQACGFRDAFPQIEAKGALVIGVSPDAPEALAKWRAKEQLPYILLSDPEHRLAEAFGAWGEKSMYGKKYMGVIRSHFVISADGSVETAEIKISPKDSVKKGVEALLKDA